MDHQAQNLSRKGSEPIEQQGTHANGMVAKRKGLALWVCVWMRQRRSDIRVSAPLRYDNPPPTSAHRRAVATSHTTTPSRRRTSRRTVLSVRSFLGFTLRGLIWGSTGPCSPQSNRASLEVEFGGADGEAVVVRGRWGMWTRRRLRAGQAMRQKGLREPVQCEHGIQIGRIHANITISPTPAIKFHRGLRHIWQSEGRRISRFSIIPRQWSVSHIFFATVAQFRFSLQHLHCYVHFGSFAICLRSGFLSLTVRGPRVRIPVRSVRSANLRPAAKFRY
ncbi:hypothetical protein C8J57DRAFT_1380195 [Mycena rebaudengoi]|nr:hypothetical protein C8J57DRAFT_1380195 [Mycena rebaudengoi]